MCTEPKRVPGCGSEGGGGHWGQTNHAQCAHSNCSCIGTYTNIHTHADTLISAPSLTDDRLNEHLARLAGHRMLQCAAVHAPVGALLHQLFAPNRARLHCAPPELVLGIGDDRTAAAAVAAAGQHRRIGAIAARRRQTVHLQRGPDGRGVTLERETEVERKRICISQPR